MLFYDVVYVCLDYLNGDFLLECGVCVDVVICVLCSQQVDLQKWVYEDMQVYFFVYLNNWKLKCLDSNIDYCCVLNLEIWFQCYNKVLLVIDKYSDY